MSKMLVAATKINTTPVQMRDKDKDKYKYQGETKTWTKTNIRAGTETKAAIIRAGTETKAAIQCVSFMQGQCRPSACMTLPAICLHDTAGHLLA
jgi:hypothetical protein